jgi:hypothetical protein
VRKEKRGPRSFVAFNSSFITYHSSLKYRHVIPRFRDDPHFPNPIWGARRREPAPRRTDLSAARRLLAACLAALAASRVADTKT